MRGTLIFYAYCTFSCFLSFDTGGVTILLSKYKRVILATGLAIVVFMSGFSVPVYAANEKSDQVKDAIGDEEDSVDSENEKEVVCWTAVEEERKGKEIIAAAQAEQDEFEAQLATYFSESDIIMLAQLIDIEANSVYPLNRRAAVGWTVLNRLDNGRWGPTTISGIIAQSGQYAWYSGRSYSELNYNIAHDVLTRWATEKIEGCPNFGRVLPPNYESFYGDGSQNHFYDVNGNYWDFSVEYDPYENW